MLRMWRHLHLLKRGGRGHDPSGAAGTAPGELVVLCPACPYPEINLPDGWESVAKSSECVGTLSLCFRRLHSSRYLYYQSFGIDACFRFKQRQISSYEKDPELGPGFAYVVAWEPYHRYLSKSGNRKEVRDLLFLVGGLRLTIHRLVPVQAYPPLNTQTRNSRRDIPPLVSFARHVATSSFSRKVLASFRREKGLSCIPKPIHSLLKSF